jgi:DNA-binding MarR family transcriptional regulator
MFVVASGIALLGFLLTWLLPERPLRETVAAAAGDVGGDVGESFPIPTDSDSLSQLLRGLSVLADRDVQRRHIEQIVARAGLDLTPAAAWLLVRIERDPALDPLALSHAYRVEPEQIRAALRYLHDRGLIVEKPPTNGGGPQLFPTAAGCDALRRLVAARRAHLAELCAEWSPERRAEMAELLRRLARELVPDASLSAPVPATRAPFRS